MPDHTDAAFSDPRAIAVRRVRFELTPADVDRAKKLAEDIVGAGEPVPTIVTHVHQTIRPTYGLSGYKRGPLAILDDGRGDCLETSAVTVMLLRAAGVPCRLVSEICAANFEPGAALAVLVPTAAASPFTNSHVWLEAWMDDGWQPVDARFGVVGMEQWRLARLQPRGGQFGFRFPVQLTSLGPQGSPDEDLVEPYLLRPFEQLGDSGAFKQWMADVAHSRDLDRATRFLGARLMLAMPRLRRMSRCLAELLAMQASD